MKKIISLGAAAAVLSLTAVAASAAIAPEATSEPVAGGEYVVNVVANDYTAETGGFTLQVSDNLTYVSHVEGTGVVGFYNPENGKYAFAGTAAPANGTVLLTVTFTVDAAADEEVSVALVPDAGFEEGVDVNPVVNTVLDGGGADVPDVPSTEPATDTVPSTQPEPTTETPVVPTTETPSAGPSIVTPTTPTEPSSEEDNAKTGIALAVVPVVLAAAGVVVAKKRK